MAREVVFSESEVETFYATGNRPYHWGPVTPDGSKGGPNWCIECQLAHMEWRFANGL